MTSVLAPIITDHWHSIATDTALDLAPGVPAGDRSGDLDPRSFDRLKASGLTSALVPIEFGGGGATFAELGGILRDLGRVDPSTAVTLAMHSHLVAAQVWRQRHGIDSSAVLGKVAAGAVLISTGASDWIGSNGSTRVVDGGYRVTARKSPASGCEIGDVLVSSIRWDDAPDGPKVLHFSVPFTAEGVSIEKTWDTIGLRATGSHTVVLDDVFVPEAAVSLMRPADVWHPVWNIVMGVAMPLIMSAYVGMADAAVDEALALVSGRTEPHVLQLAGEMLNEHTTTVDMVDAMLASSDDLNFANTDAHSGRTLARKSVAADAAIRTVRLAMELAGGVGFTRGGNLERLYRDVHGCLFHPLPRAKQVLLSGRVALTGAA